MPSFRGGGKAVRLAGEQSVEAKTRFGEAMILDHRKHLHFGCVCKRDAMLCDVPLVLRRIIVDLHGYYVATKCVSVNATVEEGIFRSRNAA